MNKMKNIKDDDLDWIKEINPTMNVCEAYYILNVGDEIIIDAIDNWEDNPNQWGDTDEIRTFYNVKAKVLALDVCNNIHRSNESNANTILVSIEEDGYYGFDDLWARDFVGTLPSQCQKDNCMFLICDTNEEEYQIKLIEPPLNESKDLDWISDTSNKIQNSGIGHDGHIISLKKVYFDFLRTIAKAENNYNPTYESQATLDTKYTRKVKDYLNLSSRDYQGLARELLRIGLDEAFKMYFDNKPQLSESDLDWIKDINYNKYSIGDTIEPVTGYHYYVNTIDYVKKGPISGHQEATVMNILGDFYEVKFNYNYLSKEIRKHEISYYLLIDEVDNTDPHGDKKTITEAAGISFEARKWGEIIYNDIMNNPNEKKRLIIDGYEHPEAFNGFPIDYVVIDFYDKLTGYGQKHSGYDKDGNYVVLLYVQPKLLQGQGGYSLKSALNHEMKHAWDDYNRLSKGLPSIDNTKETKELYNKDFILMLSDQNVRGPIKELLKYYYYLSKLETTAYLENVYEGNPVYEKIVREITSKDFESFKDRFDLDINWHLVNTAYDIPFIKKFKTPLDFIDYSSSDLKRRALKVLKKINKMKYIHGKL